MVEPGHREHAQQVHPNGKCDGGPTHADRKNGEAGEVHEDERDDA